jgi:hypothetical protein
MKTNTHIVCNSVRKLESFETLKAFTNFGLSPFSSQMPPTVLRLKSMAFALDVRLHWVGIQRSRTDGLLGDAVGCRFTPY